MFRWMLLLISASAIAQQQIVPKELTKEQGKLFSEVTQSVSAPCCNNGIPVAFHMSGMANQIRDEITAAIVAGKSKTEIFDQLGNARYGADNSSIIFTIPERTPIGYLAYIFPALVGLLGIGFIILYRKHRIKRTPLSEDELLDKYKDAILERIGQAS